MSETKVTADSSAKGDGLWSLASKWRRSKEVSEPGGSTSAKSSLLPAPAPCMNSPTILDQNAASTEEDCSTTYIPKKVMSGMVARSDISTNWRQKQVRPGGSENSKAHGSSSSSSSSFRSTRATSVTQLERQPRTKKFTEVIRRGMVVGICMEKQFGFLAPIPSAKANSQSDGTDSGDLVKDVFFRFGPGGALSGGMVLTEGDTMEYLVNDDKAKPRAMFARMCHCKPRTMEDLVAYVRSLVVSAEEHADVVLRGITMCPAGFQLVLDHPDPSSKLVMLTLQLCGILRRSKDAGLYSSRLKQVYSLFCGSRFLVSKSGVQKFAQVDDHDVGRRDSLKEFLLQLLQYEPSQLQPIVPILRRLAACEIPSTPLDGYGDGSEDSLDLRKVDDSNLQSRPCEGGGFLLKVLHVLAGSGNDVPGLPWTQLPLLPTCKELNSTPPKSDTSTLPVVIQKGSYGSAENYIDTYFRLLREDCFAGLRQGIQALRNANLDDRDMKVWFHVSAVGIHFERTSPGVTFALRLGNVTKARATPLPLGGSLVCISDDGGRFSSPIWGVVSRCEEDGSKTCICFVEIVQGGTAGLADELSASDQVSQFARLMKGVDLVMAESPTYYRAYQPVLDALLHTDPLTIPFRAELVSAAWPHEAPEYLKSTAATLDWSCIFDTKNSSQGEIREGVEGVTSLPKQGYRTSLDESQMKAVDLAVRSRLTLIQGPPGTGKTYIGVKIVQLLLSASTFPPESPVVLITYKNHALDQFLDKCLSFCTKEGSLVRVGGRCKHPGLQKYNLQAHVAKNDEFSSDRVDNIRKMEKIQEDMELALQAVHKSQLGFNPILVITQASELQQRCFLARLANSTQVDTCLGLFPEGLTLAEALQAGLPEDADPGSVAQLNWLKKSLVEEIKRWMPKSEVFKSVQACLSLKRPVQNEGGQSDSASGAANIGDRSTGKVSQTDAVEEDLDDARKEEEEKRSAYESVRQEIKDEDFNGSGRRNGADKPDFQWLKNNFMALSELEKDGVQAPGVSFQDLDLAPSHYDWLTLENPWDLSLEHRAILVHIFWQRNVEEACHRYASIKAQYDVLVYDMDEISKRRKLAVLRKAKIIGMTTTGAAMHQSMLKCLSPAVVLVEEAAEILEPQVLAVLNPDLQHLILIGDHHQLRPSVASYDLERWHGFGVSMFERLVEHNKLPYQALNLQCRMREEFVPMLLPMYPSLKSHKELVSGGNNKAPTCMAHTMHFWSHQYEETSQRSYVNQGEAQMVLALARWLVSEVNDPGSIKVLAAYNAQVSLIHKLLKAIPGMEEVEVHTIDKFQGAESHIVIVSLVRSNPNGKIGHLSMRNRLCVAASRARCGVYMCGNHTTLTHKSPHWRTLISYFEAQHSLSTTIPLRCPRHPDEPSFALSYSNAPKFNPSGVCDFPCGGMLPCGHACSSTCHAGSHCQCIVPVVYTFPQCGHSLTKKCHEDEEFLDCQTRISYKFELCGHITERECREINGKGKSSLRCQFVCGKELECGHACSLLCSDDCAGVPCQSCLEIEKEKARIQLQILIKAIESKRKELDIEIQKLKATGHQGVVVKEVRPGDDSAKYFYMAKDRTEKFVQAGSKKMPVVTKVEKIENLQLQRRFLEAQRELISPVELSDWLFYGTTSEDLLKRIVEKGFRATHQKVYSFDVNSSRITGECGGSNKLLLCEVQLGKTCRVTKVDPKMNLQKLHKAYDSLSLVADGAADAGAAARPEKHVVYNPEQAIPRFIVHYKLVDLHALAEVKGFESFGAQQAQESHGVFRVSLTPSLNFQGDCPEEYHFRMAESQFFRMSKNRSLWQVRTVDYIYNVELVQRYNKKREEFKRLQIEHEERFVFHGTDAAAVDKIATEGFKIGGEGVRMKCGAAYGHGVYTAVIPDISVAYCRDSQMMLLSVALPGRENEHFNYGGSNEVLVIKDVSQLLPKYVVHYIKMTKIDEP